MKDDLEARTLKWGSFITSEKDIASEVAEKLVKEHPEIDQNKAYELALKAVRETTKGQGNMALYQGLVANAIIHANRLYSEKINYY